LIFNLFNDVVPVPEIMWPEMRLVCCHGVCISTGFLLSGLWVTFLSIIWNVKMSAQRPDIVSENSWVLKQMQGNYL